MWVDEALEIRTSIVFNSSYSNNTILSYFLFYFFVNEFYFLIPAVISQICIPTVELVIVTETQANEANAETETQPVTVETKISKCST